MRRERTEPQVPAEAGGAAAGVAAAGPAPRTRFDRDALEHRFEALDRLPRGVRHGALVHGLGHPAGRLDAVREAWRALRAGTLPSTAAAWPPPDVAPGWRRVLDRLGMPASCHASADLAEQVLRHSLADLDRIPALSDRVGRPRAVALVLEAFEAEWQQRGAEVRAVLRVVAAPDGLLSFARWSEVRGLLHSGGWDAIVAAHEAIERLPELAELIDRLGRRRPSDGALARATLPLPDDPDAEDLRPAPRIAEVERSGIEGVRLSGELGAALAIERSMLRHRDPRIRRAWSARLAEARLLSHRPGPAFDGMDRPRSPRPGASERPRALPRPRAGPMLLCVDTSASMAGAAEAVAKAVLLHAVRTAARERRACWLYAFGGPGEVVEIDLSAAAGPGEPSGPMRRPNGEAHGEADDVGMVAGSDEDGSDEMDQAWATGGPEGPAGCAAGAAPLARLGAFLERRFGGGTDIAEPFARALARAREGGWRAADLLVATDGEFGVPAEVAAELDAARSELGLRVEGVLVGDRETIGLRRVADAIHWVPQWRRFGRGNGEGDGAGAGRGESPVHDKALTALYFPNAFAPPGTASSSGGLA